MRKQSWYRDYLLDLGQDPQAFVGSARVKDDPAKVAARVGVAFGFDNGLRSEAQNGQRALSAMFERCKEPGEMVLRSGVAGNNPHRPLLVGEFRGFALTDTYAPLIFINARDSKAAQMFTLVHELVH